MKAWLADLKTLGHSLPAFDHLPKSQGKCDQVSCQWRKYFRDIVPLLEQEKWEDKNVLEVWMWTKLLCHIRSCISSCYLPADIQVKSHDHVKFTMWTFPSINIPPVCRQHWGFYIGGITVWNQGEEHGYILVPILSTDIHITIRMHHTIFGAKAWGWTSSSLEIYFWVKKIFLCKQMWGNVEQMVLHLN